MKLCFVDVMGIKRVVFNRSSVWNREKDFWYKEGRRCVRVPDLDMIERIKHICRNPRFRVWVHNETVNVVEV